MLHNVLVLIFFFTSYNFENIALDKDEYIVRATENTLNF